MRSGTGVDPGGDGCGSARGTGEAPGGDGRVHTRASATLKSSPHPSSPVLRPLRIGDVVAENNVMAAPMAGYTDVAFRILARRCGAGITSTEQVGAGSLERQGPKSVARAAIDGRERPVMLQLITSDPEEAATGARLVEHADLLGLNMGCPAPQVARAGCGAALLDKPATALALVSAVKEANSRPLVVKMRLGNGRRIEAPAFARALVEAGADALIVHGRTACEHYAGRADWAAIGEIVRAVDVPVVANGDVVDGPSAAACLAATGAAGVAVGRAALGDPRVFERIVAYLARGEVVRPDRAAQTRDLAEYLTLALAAGVHEHQLLKQAQRFTKGLRGAARLRAALTKDALRDPESLALRLREAATWEADGRVPA